MGDFMKFLSFKRVSFAVLILLSAITLLSNPNYKKEKSISDDVYVLKSYKNCLALYKNDEIFEIYDDIVLNTLPVGDVIVLNKGIVIENLSDVSNILEDYDG